MNTEAHLNTEATLDLTQAVLIYASSEHKDANNKDRNEAFVRATVHEVVPPSQCSLRPQIGPGVLLTREALHGIINGLAGSVPCHTFLPANVLCTDTTLLAWHVPARRRVIHFSTADKDFNKLVSGREVPHPALLFLARPGRLQVLALGDDTRPTLDSQLFVAPYCNLYDNGAMCTGTVKLPGAPSISEIPVWEEAFYDSSFTHTNLKGDVTAHKGGHHALWREMVKHKGVFPGKYLRPTSHTLASLMKAGK